MRGWEGVTPVNQFFRVEIFSSDVKIISWGGGG